MLLSCGWERLASHGAPCRPAAPLLGMPGFVPPMRDLVDTIHLASWFGL